MSEVVLAWVIWVIICTFATWFVLLTVDFCGGLILDITIGKCLIGGLIVGTFVTAMCASISSNDIPQTEPIEPSTSISTCECDCGCASR